MHKMQEIPAKEIPVSKCHMKKDRHGNVSLCDEPRGVLQTPFGDFFLAMAQWQHLRGYTSPRLNGKMGQIVFEELLES